MRLGKPKTLKTFNRKIILGILMESDAIKISELSKKTKLSKTTLMKILKHFLEKGLVVMDGKGKSTDEGGKKPNLYRFNPDAGYMFSVQVFPTELFSILTDLNSKPLLTLTEKIGEDEKIDIIIEKITKTFKSLKNNNIDLDKIISIAVGSHGITDINKGTVITSPHFPSWGENLPFRDLLRKRIKKDIPIIIDNQIRFQALAEKNNGSGKKKKNIIVVEGGEGLVAGIIIKDSIKRGMHNLAGEIGHMVINPDGKYVCACGGRGCFEAMISINRVIEMARERYNSEKDSLIFKEKKSKDIDIFDIFEASNKNDKFARELIDDVVKWFAIGFSNMILMYDPEIIIIQGIYSKAGDYFLNRLKEQINEVSLLKIDKDVEIKYSKYGNDARLIGASLYLVSQFSKSIFEDAN